jgi:hypothetical protein
MAPQQIQLDTTGGRVGLARSRESVTHDRDASKKQKTEGWVAQQCKRNAQDS